jgi:ribosomal protein S3
MYPIISIIETSALQKLRQRYGTDEAQQRPGHSDVQVKVFSGNQAQDGTETHYDDTQNINSYGSVGRTGAAAYAVKAQKATYKQAYVKQSYHSHLNLPR